MKTFTAKVVDKSGKSTTITEEAISEQIFEESLYKRGFFVIKINEFSTGQSFFKKSRLNRNFLLDFTYNVYTLLDFGIDINEVFKILAEIYMSGKENDFVNEVISFLKKGEKVSVAIKNSQAASIFDDFYISMISSGEQSGNLRDSFRLIYQYLKNNQMIRDRLLTAAIYPMILLFMGFLSLNILLLFILPMLKEMYTSMNFTPNLLIQILFNISGLLSQNKIVYFLSLILIFFGLIIFFRTEVSKNLIRFALDHLPILSKISRLNNKIKVSFSLEILLKGGASLEEALFNLSKIETNPILKKEYLKSLNSLKEGESVRSSFKNLKIFDPKDLNIIEIADSISKTPEGFEKLYIDANYRLEAFLGIAFELLTPVILILLGMFMGLIMYIVISPNLNLLQQMN